MNATFDHIVLNVRDIDPMIRFYSQTLGFRTERLELYQRGEAPFPSVRFNADSVIDLFPPALWGGGETEETHLNHFCLAMDKAAWDAALLYLTQEMEKRKEDDAVKVLEPALNPWAKPWM